MAAPMKLQFGPLNSGLDAGFWYKLSQNKLEIYKLDDKAKNINGYYSNSGAKGLVPRINVDHTAFDSSFNPPAHSYITHGLIYNKNKLDEFKNCDKKSLLDQNAMLLWNDITSGRAIADPSLLSRFFVLTFADLKKYHYWYWFAFPAFILDTSGIDLVKPVCGINDRLTEQQISDLQQQHDVMKKENGGYFLFDDSENRVLPLQDFASYIESEKMPLVCFADPCTMEKNPGWPLRNLLTLISYHWVKEAVDVDVLCYRDRTSGGQRDSSHSIVCTIKLVPVQSKECPASVGWEKNERVKLGPRMVDLSQSMDQTKLAESSVDLNLKLMRWRLLPDLDLDKMKQTRCLLLGAGTLGCNVARNLMGYGVRTITFVDNGKVSYSNPVRQSLYTFQDSSNGGRWKAETAAKALQDIFPGVVSRGVNISIPMPGHAVSEKDGPRVESDVKMLESLIEEHDVVFLLLDTREARWLPTVVAASKRKIVINAALGFDTFLISRHGLKITPDKTSPPASPVDGATSKEEFPEFGNDPHGSELGCYYCNDVVGPADSTRDRTLDQQCTVSRPGMSMMVSALAAELMATLIQHPDGGYARVDTQGCTSSSYPQSACCLGVVPHQIRGFLSQYLVMLPFSRSYNRCTACSDTVISAYEKGGFDFLLRCFNESSFLEDLTGLSALQEETKDMEILGYSDDESV